MLRRLTEGVAWRWRLAQRMRFLRKHFRNGEELAQSYKMRVPCDAAICLDGSAIKHPPGRRGLAGMILELWLDEVYTGKFYQPRPDDVVVDAGANIGLFSILVGKRQPSCRVLAFEPFPENYRLLEENVAASRIGSVQTFHRALAGRSGVAAIVDGGGRSQDHRISTEVADPSQSIATSSLADVLALAGPRIALFKCDIEGSEYDLFAEATPAEIQRVDRFALEYHEHMRAGTLQMIQEKLADSHAVSVVPAATGGYGMLYASRRS